MTDADNLLDRCRVELGEPEAVYRVGAGRFWAKFLLGFGLLAGGLVGNYFFWVHGPRNFGHALAKLLLAPPFFGVALLWHLYRTRGVCVLAYPAGLFRLQGGEFESYPWAEVTEVRLKAEKATVVLERHDGEPALCWLAVEPPALRLGSAAVTVQRADGVAARLTPAVGGYAELAERVQRETFRRLWPAARDRFRSGERVAFGQVEAGRAGLQLPGRGPLAWSEISEVTVANKLLTLKRKGKWLPWAATPLDQVPNPHVLLALVEMARRQGTGDREQETEDEKR